MSSSSTAVPGDGSVPSPSTAEQQQQQQAADQLMSDIGEKFAPSLDQRLQYMDEVDQRIDDLLGVVTEVLASLDKDKPLSKAKMEELYKKYEQHLGEIQRGIAEQLTYMEQVCIGAEHQGSTYHYHQVVELSAARLRSLRAHLASLKSDTAAATAQETTEGEEEAAAASNEADDALAHATTQEEEEKENGDDDESESERQRCTREEGRDGEREEGTPQQHSMEH